MATKSMLVNFVGYPNEVFNLVPDNGLANLAACLIEAGHETTIWDCCTLSTMEDLYPYHAKEDLGHLTRRIMSAVQQGDGPATSDLQALYALEDRIDQYQDRVTRDLGRRMGDCARRRGFDFVGFKLWSGAGFHGCIILAEEIRKLNSNIMIFGGGPHVDMFMERSFGVTEAFDVFAYGEGEEVIVQLAEYAEGKRDLADVSNAIYLVGGHPVRNPQTRVRDIDSLPLPCYDEEIYPALSNDEKIKVIHLDESRGCPNSCNFCIHPIKSGRRRRAATAASFVDKLEQVIEKYGFRAFRFAGSNPPVGLRREIAAEILRRGIKVSFAGFAHVRGTDIGDFKLLKRAGCVALSFGMESGSQRILDQSINKHVRVEEIKEAIESCKEAGIAAMASIIVPAPHETEDTKEETFRLLCETRPDAVVVCFPIMVLGTVWERERERFGFGIDNMDALYRHGMTRRMRVITPALLWRPLEGYTLNGKTFRELGMEMADFVRRLDAAGFATQFLDPVFLMAGPAGMRVTEFAKLVSQHMAGGEVESLRTIVQRINHNVLDNRMLAAAV